MRYLVALAVLLIIAGGCGSSDSPAAAPASASPPASPPHPSSFIDRPKLLGGAACPPPGDAVKRRPYQRASLYRHGRLPLSRSRCKRVRPEEGVRWACPRCIAA